jgi:hypothetical protein
MIDWRDHIRLFWRAHAGKQQLSVNYLAVNSERVGHFRHDQFFYRQFDIRPFSTVSYSTTPGSSTISILILYGIETGRDMLVGTRVFHGTDFCSFLKAIVYVCVITVRSCIHSPISC